MFQQQSLDWRALSVFPGGSANSNSASDPLFVDIHGNSTVAADVQISAMTTINSTCRGFVVLESRLALHHHTIFASGVVSNNSAETACQLRYFMLAIRCGNNFV